MSPLTTSTVVVFCTVLFGCATTELSDRLAPDAVKFGQQTGATDLGCSTATAEVVSKKTIEAEQTTGWRESPSLAEYTIGVSGCGKRTSYPVTCDKLGKCKATSALTAAGTAPRQLADELQPIAISAALQRGSRDLSCPEATAAVTTQETIDAGQTTGWYEPPHQAVYAVDVTGCGKRRSYLVDCERSKNSCATGGLSAAKGAPAQLADTWEPQAIRAAQEKAAGEMQCPAATAKVTRKETVEEGQTTGWYEQPYRALYSMTVDGCAKQATYLVVCDSQKKVCQPGTTAR
jgi:hypothetical protein